MPATDGDKAPTARIEPRFLEVDEGDSIEFDCMVEGSPAPTIRWNRGADGPLPDHATVQNGVFRIASIRKSDEAEYYCTATNAAGTASVRTIIYVRRKGRTSLQARSFPQGDGVVQLEERRTRDPKTRGSNPVCVRSTTKTCQRFNILVIFIFLCIFFHSSSRPDFLAMGYSECSI